MGNLVVFSDFLYSGYVFMCTRNANCGKTQRLFDQVIMITPIITRPPMVWSRKLSDLGMVLCGTVYQIPQLFGFSY